jgi:hypothetical protein
MTSASSNQAMYDQLMQINDKAFDEGNYEAAYHALVAALHCAIPLREGALLRELEARAREQRDWIDTQAADHALSAQSAAVHGHRSSYASLVMQIESQQLIQRQRRPYPKLDQ